MEERDRFLTDFSKGFSGSHRDTDGSVLDGEIPQAVVDAYYRVFGKWSHSEGQQKQRKDYAGVAGGVSISGGAHAIACFQGRGNIVLGSKAAAQEFVDAVQEAINAMEDDPVRPEPAVSPANQNAKVAFGNPILQARMEQNLRELEKWAEASSRSYPRWG